MTVTLPTIPNEQTPLLGAQRTSEFEGIPGSDSETATLASLSDHDGLAKCDPDEGPKLVKKTPLPWAQFSIVLFLLLAEPLTSQVISPFAPELIRNLNVVKDDAQVGYYVGLLHSLFFATQACTILHWSTLSDYIGRKPVVLTGLFGLSLSMYCFALSRSFWGLVLSRALNGALNGNVGVLRSIIAEMTDHTNMSLAYSYQPIAWSTGSTLGPIIGGAFSRPAERFPNLFGNSKFFKEYPYFLPCAVPATFTVIAWLIAALFLKETHPSPKPIRDLVFGERKRAASEEDPLIISQAQPQDETAKPLSLRELLTRDVIVASANYTFLGLIDMSFRTLQPVFFSTPIALGGLGLDPPMIGTVLSFFGVLNGIFTVFFFSRLTDRFGVKAVYVTGISATVPCYVLFPVINYLARNSIERSGELGLDVWIAVGLQVVMSVLVAMCYGAVFIFIAAAAPNKASLGATNGLAQVTVSIVRAIGPSLATSLFSLSIDKDHHYMNGGLVYYVTVMLGFCSIWVGLSLPKNPFKDRT